MAFREWNWLDANGKPMLDNDDSIRNNAIYFASRETREVTFVPYYYLYEFALSGGQRPTPSRIYPASLFFCHSS